MIEVGYLFSAQGQAKPKPLLFCLAASDPKEKAKDDARDWINTSVESLTAKVGLAGAGVEIGASAGVGIALQG